LLFSRFGGGAGVGPPDWQENATFEGKWQNGLYEIQDKYKVPTILGPSINSKWGAIQDLLDRAKGDTSDTWYINFSSGTSVGAYPNAVADRINPKLGDYINSYLSSVHSGTTNMNKVGTLMMDFPSDDLINRIISAIDLSR
jgi:1-phosphatidylinositol phosphodiesterase